MTRTRDLANIGPGVQTGNRNILINGAFDIWQRGTSGTSSGGAIYSDMWHQYTDTGSGTQSRDLAVTVPGVAMQSYKFTAGGSATNFSLWQIIESANCSHLVNQTVTLSFYAQVSTARNINVTMALATTADMGWTGAWTTFSNTPVAIGTSMARYTVTATVPSNMKTMNIGFSSGGTNFAAGSTLNITGVQLELGSVATPFEKRSIANEVSLCQRYFCSSFPIGVAPTTPSGTGMSGGNDLTSYTPTVSNSYSNVKAFPVPMRSAPTLTIYNSETAATGSWSFYNSSNKVGDFAITSASSNSRGFLIYQSGTYTVSNGAWSASAEL
jgi:hypothetical protein